MLPVKYAWNIIFSSLIVTVSESAQGRLAVQYSDAAVDHFLQPGLSLNSRERYAAQSVHTPVKVPNWTPATAPYHVAPGSGNGPARWRGQHVYTPRSSCIQPTPTSRSTTTAPSACHASTVWRRITETLTTCSPTVCMPSCLSISTSLLQTVVNTMCVLTTQTTYTTKTLEVTYIGPDQSQSVSEKTVVGSSSATSACRNIGIQTPALGSGVTLSSNGNPCYAITVTPTVVQSDTCTLDVGVTSYGQGIGTAPNGRPSVDANTDAQLDPVTTSETTCTF
ncbi:uncharacterized protein LOC129588829 [Paramacrobiotus metropolitanus]|uniref:uncharacterized protein LOC129588829 n=1 Tax=Paramacrobiotus metropolitanus TaxID=2943436 RepID=UPI002445B3E4|nr:uncharacterized protein LOC129588829 [Paramacrobiotus metropolitanus]